MFVDYRHKNIVRDIYIFYHKRKKYKYKLTAAMINRSNYNKKIISAFDLIGTYFIDVFYNDLYLRAKEAFADGAAPSITDAYRSNISNYARGISTRFDLYMIVIKKLHEYYHRTTSFGANNFSTFEDMVLSKFIPKEYYNDFSDRDKDKILHEIIVKSVANLSEIVLRKENIHKIIDRHSDITNVTMLQDNIVDIFIIQREAYFAKFTSELIKDSNVPTQLFDKIKTALKSEMQRRIAAEQDKEKAINIITGLMRKISEYEKIINSYEAKPAEAPKSTVEPIHQFEQPVYKSTMWPIERPTERPVERPIEKPAERPVERPVEPLVERPIEKPVDRPVETPVEARMIEPVEMPPRKQKHKSLPSIAIDDCIDMPDFNILEFEDPGFG